MYVCPLKERADIINNHGTQRPEAWRTNSPRSAASTEPQRSIPAALVPGLAIVTVLYLAMNAMYLYALPIDAMSGLLAIAEKASVAMFGLFAADVVAAILALALLGSMSAMVLAGPRVYFAMARDGLFPRGIGVVHPSRGTSARAIALQCGWASVLIVFFGAFEPLVVYTVVRSRCSARWRLRL